MYRYLRSLLFCLDPERAHDWVLGFLKIIYRPFWVKYLQRRAPKSPVTLFGLTFPNPIGLAAGLDKNGDYIDALFGLGFGFIEVGAVTPKAQPGNPKPRIFRLPKAQSLINRMGFNNLGVDYLVEQLRTRKIRGIVGVNIGKNLTTPIEDAYQDYRIVFEKVFPFADYVTINISSPNTPRLRELQAEEYLHDLLHQLKKDQARLSALHERSVPLLLKISPDMSTEQLQQIANVVLNHHIDGIVVANTTSARTAVTGMMHAHEQGGLSGAPLFATTLRIVKSLYQILGDRVPIIAVGGIMSCENATALLASGARLVQLYTGLIYQGPKLIRDLVLACASVTK